MKKIFMISILVFCLLLTGCSKDSIDKKLEKKYSNLKSYALVGNLQITNNEDTYNYDVEVKYKKKDKYSVRLVNKSNNHEQVIIKNDEGVYVKTQESTKQKLNVI